MIKYTLIGLAPYSFYYDQSKTYAASLLRYFIALNDLHNFWMPIEKYRSLFREEYLRIKFQPPDDDMRKFYFEGIDEVMNSERRIKSRESVDDWKEKNYSETHEENIKIFNDYLTLCEKNNSRPIVFLPPMSEGYIKYFDRKKLDEYYCIIEDSRKKYSSMIFVDGWKTQGFTDSDFYDVSHLNAQGSVKFSAMFNDFIERLEMNKI